MNLRIVAQGTEDGQTVEDVTDNQVNGEVDGAVDGEAPVPEVDAKDAKAEEEAKQVQVYVCASVSICVCLCWCVYPGRAGMGASICFLA